MKKLINDPADVVADALRGLAAARPELRVQHEDRVVFRGDAPVHGKVGIVSGGGSGHEPMHAGFVGPGMLDAACAGEVFTSPVPDQVMAATRGVGLEPVDHRLIIPAAEEIGDIPIFISLIRLVFGKPRPIILDNPRSFFYLPGRIAACSVNRRRTNNQPINHSQINSIQ